MSRTATSPADLVDAARLISTSREAELVFAPNLVIAACSEEYARLQNLSRSALIGLSAQEAFHEGPALAELVASLEMVCRSGRPHRTVARVPAPIPLGRPATGSLRVMTNIPVLDTNGGVAWILHCLGDGPELGQVDHPSSAIAAALEAAEARLRSILQTVPDAMIIIDERGRIESLSSTAEGLFGYSMAEMTGKNVSQLMPSPDREQHDTYLERYLATGERRIIGIGRIVTGQRKDGSTFPMHLTVGELRSSERHYFTGFIRDLTDQQLTEDRLKELQSEVTHMSRYTALGEMASTLAHEINQPLTAISNYLRGSQRLLDGMAGDTTPKLREALGKAAEQALRAGHIIRRLREFVARGESDRRVENLAKLIEDASTLALVGAREAGISVQFRLDRSADAVLADRIQIQQVLVNLIRNAIESMTGTANERALDIETVASLDAGDLIKVSVSDTGTGLAPEVAANLFQPFVTTKRKGMGLGLSICRTIIEAHGGKIWVEGRPGGGTVFSFTLRSATIEESEHGR